MKRLMVNSTVVTLPSRLLIFISSCSQVSLKKHGYTVGHV